MYRPLVTLAALLALAGCSSSVPAPVGLKESCDALGVVLQDFGQVAPTAQRYADYLWDAFDATMALPAGSPGAEQ